MTPPYSLAVLTDPIPMGEYYLPEIFKRFVYPLKCKLYKHSHNIGPKFRGHYSVTRSLVEGLDKIGASFVYNPRSLAKCGDTFFVLSGVHTLKQAIKLKRLGKIRKLIAGPNIVHFASDHEGFLASPEVDAVVVPCEWVADHYLLDQPSLEGRIIIWPAGVDTTFWSPLSGTSSKTALVYVKNNFRECSIIAYINYLQSLGWRVNVLQYGSFNQIQYRDALRQASLMVGFSQSESQGIAWAEAWSVDVPTLLWRNSGCLLHGRFLNVSSAPYLQPGNGLFFDDLEHFKCQLHNLTLQRDKFQPRDWTLREMSDEVCAEKIFDRITAC